MALTGPPGTPDAGRSVSGRLLRRLRAAIALLAGIISARDRSRIRLRRVSSRDTSLPDSAHPSIVPFQQFARAMDGSSSPARKEKFWQALCRALDLEDLLEDPRTARPSSSSQRTASVKVLPVSTPMRFKNRSRTLMEPSRRRPAPLERGPRLPSLRPTVDTSIPQVRVFVRRDHSSHATAMMRIRPLTSTW
jgi:hypothetical protein